LAADQTRDPNVEVIEKVEIIEKPKPGAGWSHSGHTGGGHTGHDGKFRPKEVIVEQKVHREEKRKGPPPKKSLTDLP
jgi:hypothetical protein